MLAFVPLRLGGIWISFRPGGWEEMVMCCVSEAVAYGWPVREGMHPTPHHSFLSLLPFLLSPRSCCLFPLKGWPGLLEAVRRGEMFRCGCGEPEEAHCFIQMTIVILRSIANGGPSKGRPYIFAEPYPSALQVCCLGSGSGSGRRPAF